MISHMDASLMYFTLSNLTLSSLASSNRIDLRVTIDVISAITTVISSLSGHRTTSLGGLEDSLE